MKAQIMREGLSLNHLLQYLSEDVGVKAAIVNAVHRFYYDYCFSPYTERPYDNDECKKISRIHTNLILANPMWRIELNKMGYPVKYGHATFDQQPTDDMINLSFDIK